VRRFQLKVMELFVISTLAKFYTGKVGTP